VIDICKCNGEKCKVKNTCFRFTCKVVEPQSWGDFYSIPKLKDGKCGMYLARKKC
jgi:hypothetical protein